MSRTCACQETEYGNATTGFWADENRGRFPVGWSASGQMRDLIQPL
jgi:hypothetical protein